MTAESSAFYISQLSKLTAAVAIGALIAPTLQSRAVSPEALYAKAYGSTKGCLAGTGFDLALKATPVARNMRGKPVFAVLPSKDIAGAPKVLNFTFNTKELQFADSETGAYMAAQGCQISNGY